MQPEAETIKPEHIINCGTASCVDSCQLQRFCVLAVLSFNWGLIWARLAGLESRRAFERLETLLLGDNHISTWESVDELNKFPQLKDVRLTGNPLLQSEPGGLRFQVSFPI